MPKKMLKQFSVKVGQQLPQHALDANYVCGMGICKGKTFEEAKTIIVAKTSLDYYHSWVSRVPWVHPNRLN